MDTMTDNSRLLLDEYKYSKDCQSMTNKNNNNNGKIRIASNFIVVSERHSTETGVNSSTLFSPFNSTLIFT